MPSSDPEITASLVTGARLALRDARRRGEANLELVVAEVPAGRWAAATGPALRLAFGRRVIGLLTPPDRSTAHLLAQIGTRSQLPVVSTAGAASVTATGSRWVVSVAPVSTDPDAELEAPGFDPAEASASDFVRAFRRFSGRPPDAWSALGYDAAATLAGAVTREGVGRWSVDTAFREGLRVEGAVEVFGFDASGRRARIPD